MCAEAREIAGAMRDGEAQLRRDASRAESVKSRRSASASVRRSVEVANERRARRGRRRCARRPAGRRAGRWCGCGRRSAAPIAGSVAPVCSRARYMATWRGQATRAVRRGGEQLVAGDAEGLADERPGCASIVRWQRGGRRARAGRGSSRTSSASGVVDRPAGQRVVGDDADQRALERAHVVGDRARRSARARSSSASSMPSCWTRLRRIGQARGEVGRRDVGDEAGLEALAQAVLERGEVARQAVGGQDELAAGLVQRVEGVEELLLGLAPCARGTGRRR